MGVLSIQEVDVLARRRYWGLVLVSPKWSSDLPIMGSGVRWRDGSPPGGGDLGKAHPHCIPERVFYGL